MIVVVGGIKGGTGKTTIATNLAVVRSLIGRKVLLVDADEQKSASDWAQQRSLLEKDDLITTVQLSGRSVADQIKKMSSNYDEVIIDVGGRDTTSQRSALMIADVFLIPFKPRSLDIWTLGPLKTLISEIKVYNSRLSCIALINQGDCRGSDNEDALDVLKDFHLTCYEEYIGYRKSYANAASEGMGVVELKDQDRKATDEIKKLNECIYSAWKILAKPV